MSIPCVIYDTMVTLQAAVHPERKYATIEAVEDKRLTLCTSPELVAELRDVLTRPSLASKFPALTPQRIAVFLDSLNLISTSFETVPELFTWPLHPDDDHLFNLAIEAQANYLVTWESRILKLATDTTESAQLLRHFCPRLSIVTPKQLADLIKLPARPFATST